MNEHPEPDFVKAMVVYRPVLTPGKYVSNLAGENHFLARSHTVKKVRVVAWPHVRSIQPLVSMAIAKYMENCERGNPSSTFIITV